MRTSSFDQGIDKKKIISILGDPRTGLQGLGKDASQSDLKKAGRQVLQSMVKADAVTLRLQQTQEGKFVTTSTVVSAPSALSFYCLKSLKPTINEILRVWRDGLSKGQEDLTSPSSSLGLTERRRAVEKEIENVVVDILSVEKEISLAKSAGAQEEVLALRKKEEQLRKEKEQLIDQEFFLMRNPLK